MVIKRFSESCRAQLPNPDERKSLDPDLKPVDGLNLTEVTGKPRLSSTLE
jgi:hypothetical protein